jgi:PAS domain S-box-containing protein
MATDTQWLRQLQFDQLVSGIADYAIFLLDRDGYVVTWNEGAERIKGYRRDEIVGQHFELFYTAEDRAAGVPRHAMETARAHGKFEAEAWRLRKNGSRFLANVVLEAVNDASGELIGFAKITRDMTERRAMEAQLRQAQKMEAIGQLTGGVAHDFNNLLTIIIGNLDILSREPDDTARRHRAIEAAMQGAQRAATLTQQLLAFSRRQPLNPRSTDVNKLVSQTAEMLGRLLGETIAVELRLAADAWHVRIDGHQLENTLLNLAVNARDAMPDGGTLTIETANTTLRHDRLRHEGAPDGDYVMVSVSDTGTGMTGDVLEHAFEPFFTTKPQGKGTGLGLSQVYGFARQSEGTVALTSEVGEGTKVVLYIPRAVPEKEIVPEARPLAHGSERILLVEDEEGVRVLTAEILRELGFEVLEASDGPSALALLRRDTHIALLLTDVGLPGGLNGRQVAEQARELRPELRVLFTTGYARQAFADDGSLGPRYDLLRKPYLRAEVAARVRDLLDTPVWRPRETTTALIVEDEPLLREMLSSVLKSLGFEVIEAGGTAEAEELLASSALHVAIIDQSLGDGIGENVARLARNLHPGLPIVMATGFAKEALVLQGLTTTGPTVVLSKPYSLASLSRVLAEIGVPSPAS